MKLVTWNCSMDLAGKNEALALLDADIMVIQECSEKDVMGLQKTAGYRSAWFGKDKNKGLGVAAKAPWAIACGDPLGMEWIARVNITGPRPFELYPVWAPAQTGKDKRQLHQIHGLLDLFVSNPPAPDAVVMGDFNGRAAGEKEQRGKSLSQAVRRFRSLGFESAYHHLTKEAQGAEEQYSYFHRKDRTKHFHTDYVFVSKGLLPGLRSVLIYSSDEWLSFSDHMPVIVEMKET